MAKAPDSIKVDIEATVSVKLDHKKVEAALRSIISDVDYDRHKELERDEETGVDRYPDLAAEFIGLYEVGAGE